MIKRSVFFENPCHLSIRLNQLIITKRDTGEVNSLPVEDIGFIIIDHAEVTLTQSVMRLLTENNTALIVCNDKHMPVGMMLPLDCHQLQAEKFRNQIEASEALKKQIWKQTIKAKIRNQADLIGKIGQTEQAVAYHLSKVKSGDTTNEEAQASKKYWRLLFSHLPGFTRDRFGDYPNAFLNYGYAILRAAVARALIGSGLLPTVGIHHHNRYNAYPLADDIMEPYRPFVDSIVYRLTLDLPEEKELSKTIKIHLLNLLTMDVQIGDSTSPLMIALAMTSASLSRCFDGIDKKIIYPLFCR